MTPEEPQGTATASDARPFVQRMTGALQLQAPAYDEIAADPQATNQAAVVVAIAALAQALGGPERIPLADLPIALSWAYFSWLLPGTLMWVVATKILGHEANLPRLLRCLGFATVPQVLWLAGLLSSGSIPFELSLGVLIFGLALVGNVIAIRQAFAIDTIRAVQTLLLGFLAFVGVAMIIGFVLEQFDTAL